MAFRFFDQLNTLLLFCDGPSAAEWAYFILRLNPNHYLKIDSSLHGELNRWVLLSYICWQGLSWSWEYTSSYRWYLLCQLLQDWPAKTHRVALGRLLGVGFSRLTLHPYFRYWDNDWICIVAVYILDCLQRSLSTATWFVSQPLAYWYFLRA